MHHKVNIIYFIWINKDRDWKVIIEGQLFDILISKIFDVAKLYIIISCEDNNILNDVINLINISLSSINNELYEITCFNNNYYEYYGIKKLYDIAQREPDKLYVYFHSKGMFHWYNNKPHKRSEDEEILTANLIYLWNDIIYIFENNNNIDKIGYVPAHGGHIWFNFYWVRGSYLINCEDPIISDSRYYYEVWLGTGNKNDSLSYGTYKCSFNLHSAEEAIEIITYERNKKNNDSL
jgi:predicted nucleic-acid-binding Zn-ribbon protein